MRGADTADLLLRHRAHSAARKARTGPEVAPPPPAPRRRREEEAPPAGAGAERRRRQKFGLNRSCREETFSFFPSLPGGGGGREATAGANASGLGVGAARTGGGGLAPRGEVRPGGPEGGGEDCGLRVRRRVCPAQGRTPAPLPARLRGGGGGGAGGCTWWRGAGGWPAAGTSWSRCWGCCCCWRAPAPGRWSACPATSPSAKSPGAALGASCRASAVAATCAPARGTRAAAAPTGSTELVTGGCAVSSAPRSMATPSPSTKWASAKVRLPAAGPLPPGPRRPLRASCAQQSLAETLRRRRAPREKGWLPPPKGSPASLHSRSLLAPPTPLSLAGRGRGWISWVGADEWGIVRLAHVWPFGLGQGGVAQPWARLGRRGQGTAEAVGEPLGECDPCHPPHSSAVWNRAPHTVREILLAEETCPQLPLPVTPLLFFP